MHTVPDVVVFLDRDGTINRNYEDAPVYTPERFELLPRVAQGIRVLNEMGVRVAVVTNQGGIRHRGRDFSWDIYRVIERLMEDGLREEGAFVDAIYVCPHADYERCTCRKPEVGLFEQAQRDAPFDPARSFMVGDRASDVIAGIRFGLRTVLVETGWENTQADVLAKKGMSPDHVAADLHAAALFIREALTGAPVAGR